MKNKYTYVITEKNNCSKQAAYQFHKHVAEILNRTIITPIESPLRHLKVPDSTQETSEN